jgi:hypothetical protein
MNVFDQIRVELEDMSDIELVEVARESYGLDVDATDSRKSIVDRCLAVEQHNFFQ